MALENSILSIVPISIIVFFSLILIILEAFLKKERKDHLGYLALFAIFISGFFTLFSWDKNISYFSKSLIIDNLSIFFFFIFFISTSLVILLSLKYISLQNMNYGEFYALLLLSLSGMMIVVSSRDLLVILLGLEVLSLSSYALAGLKLNDIKSSEAAIKYFLLGALASAFLIYGIAFFYGISDSTKIENIVQSFSSNNKFFILTLIGFGLFIIGIGFKIALVPFHVWTPDVYQGAPTPVVALFSIAPKAAGFAVFMRVFYAFFPDKITDIIFWILWTLSALTMIVGNLMALRQKNVKRILAYSSIAHAGYILIGLLIKDYRNLLFYLVVYLFMNLGAFGVLSGMIKKRKEYLDLEDYSGLGFRYPWLGATLSVFLISLAGFPPTAGFLAKFYIFSSAVRSNLIGLTIIGVLCSLVSVYYYLRIIVYMYMKPEAKEVLIEIENPPLFLVIFICLLGVLQFGIFPHNILVFISKALASF